MATLTHPLPSGTPTDGFGPRGAVPGLGNVGDIHTGQDFAAPAGTPILAAHAGRVSRKWYDRFANGAGAGGYMVELAGDGLATRYAHMRAESPLRVGDWIEPGTPVGEVGRSGAANGDHLHLELLIGGNFVDPMPYLTTNNTPGDEEMTPQEREWLRVVHDTLTAGKAGVKHQGEVHRLLSNMPKLTTAALMSHKVKRQGGGKGETTLGATLAWLDGNLDRLLSAIKKIKP